MIEGDPDLLLEDITEGILDLLPEGIEETILVVGHLLESRRNKPKKFILISKSAKRCLMRTKEKSFGMAFSGLPKLRL